MSVRVLSAPFTLTVCFCSYRQAKYSVSARQIPKVRNATRRFNIADWRVAVLVQVITACKRPVPDDNSYPTFYLVSRSRNCVSCHATWQSRPLVAITSQFNSVHMLYLLLWDGLITPSASCSIKWSVPYMFLDWSFACISHDRQACYASFSLNSLWFIQDNKNYMKSANYEVISCVIFCSLLLFYYVNMFSGFVSKYP